MKNISLWSLVLVASFLSFSAHGKNKVLFEGFYKIDSLGQHVGYYIQRYELDPKKKQFISTYFLRTNEQGGNISESLRAVSTDKLNPVSYQYTSLQGKASKTIDAIASKNKRGKDVLQIKITDNGKLRISEAKLKEGTFFSTFLIYLLLQGQKGIQPGVKYNFNSIAEEDGKSYAGEVFVEKEEAYNGYDSFKVLYTFKNTQFVNFINSKGESLASISPALGLSAALMKNPKDAIQGQTFNQKSLAILFGDVPSGLINEMQNVKPKATPSPTPAVNKPKEDPKEQ
ncbi:MAG: hypothetical protein HRT44_13845 [Bdellovibrionales bacterium]|nr:hypothetical protein [Bdellovibrionales bacterium]